VASLAHPGGNVTGFAVMEPTLGTKLLGMLKQVAPQVARVGVLVNPDNATHQRILALLAAAAPGFAVEMVKAPAREAGPIGAAITQWSQSANYGLIVPSDPTTNAQRKLIIELAARYRMPAIYALRAATADGGLMSYGVDIPELFRQSAIYVLARLEVDHQLKFCRQLHRKIGGFLALEHAIGSSASSCPKPSSSPRMRSSSEPARVHRTARRRGRGMAGRGARAGRGPHLPSWHNVSFSA
jgi:hypothetical protein